jgi:hypothetical protein
VKKSSLGQIFLTILSLGNFFNLIADKFQSSIFIIIYIFFKKDQHGESDRNLKEEY